MTSVSTSTDRPAPEAPVSKQPLASDLLSAASSISDSSLKDHSGSVKRRRRTHSSTQTPQPSLHVLRMEQLEEMVGEEASSMVNNTSCLAIANVFIRQHIVLRILWSLAFIVCSALAIYQLYNLSTAYFDYPIHTKILSRNNPIEFPSVTICNLNPLRMSKLHLAKPELRNFLLKVKHNMPYNLTSESGRNLTNFRLTTRNHDVEMFNRLILNESTKVRLKMGYQLNDFILECSFKGIACRMKKDFQTVLTMNYGNCFTFNHWLLFNGNDKMLTSNPNRDFGLYLTLFLDTDEFLPGIVPASGIKVHVHQPKSIEEPDFSGFSIPPGYEIDVRFEAIKRKRLKKPYGDCESGEHFFKKYHIEYTYQSCLYFCLNEHILKSCKCYRTSMIFNFNLNLLKSKFKSCKSDKELRCVIANLENWEMNKRFCKCKYPCSTFEYNLEQSFAVWPIDSYKKRLVKDLTESRPHASRMINFTGNEMRKNLIHMVIYQKTALYNVFEENEGYKLASYLSNIGGTLGLYLGFSVLTGFECLEFISLMIVMGYGKCKKWYYRRDIRRTRTDRYEKLN